MPHIAVHKLPKKSSGLEKKIWRFIDSAGTSNQKLLGTNYLTSLCSKYLVEFWKFHRLFHFSLSVFYPLQIHSYSRNGGRSRWYRGLEVLPHHSWHCLNSRCCRITLDIASSRGAPVSHLTLPQLVSQPRVGPQYSCGAPRIRKVVGACGSRLETESFTANTREIVLNDDFSEFRRVGYRQRHRKYCSTPHGGKTFRVSPPSQEKVPPWIYFFRKTGGNFS